MKTEEKNVYFQLVELLEIKNLIKLQLTLSLNSMEDFPFSEKQKNDFINAIVTCQDFYDEIVAIFFQYYTYEEVEQLVGFYKTPLGKKILMQNTVVIEKSYDIGMKYGNKFVNLLTD